jgi:hypothetical protein
VDGTRVPVCERAVTGGSWLVVGFVVIAGIAVLLGLVDLVAERRGAGGGGRGSQ